MNSAYTELDQTDDSTQFKQPPVSNRYVYPAPSYQSDMYSALETANSLKLKNVIRSVFVTVVLAAIAYRIYVQFAIVPFMTRKAYFTKEEDGNLYLDGVLNMTTFPMFLHVWTYVSMGVDIFCLLAGSQFSPATLLISIGGVITNLVAFILSVVWMIIPANPADPYSMKGPVWTNWANNPLLCLRYTTGYNVTGCSPNQHGNTFLDQPPTSWPIDADYIKYVCTLGIQFFICCIAIYLSFNVPTGKKEKRNM